MLVRFSNNLSLDGGEEASFSELHLGAHVPLEFTSFNAPLPSEDIWKKFDLPEVPMTDCWSSDDFDEFDSLVEQYTSAAAVSSPFWANLDPPCKDAREIRHDCMWAGHCINEEHGRTLQQKNKKKQAAPCFVKPEVSSVRTPPSSPSKTVRTAKPNCSSASLLVNNNSVVKSTNSRSLLLNSRTNTTRVEQNPTANRYQRPALESDGDSPRPETPQSLSESEEESDDIPRFRHSLGVVIRSSVAVCGESSPADFFSMPSIKQEPTEEVVEEDDDEEEEEVDSSLAVSVSEVTGQVCRQDIKNEDEVHIKAEPPEAAFYTDHSYHLSKGSVKMENLGVQTPSDSEEEIDVVSVGEKQSGAGRLPTNPSARDRQQLQLTVASAIRQHQQPTSIPMRITIGDRTVSVRTVPTDSLVDPDRKRKYNTSRGSSGKGSKRAKYQYHHRLQHHKTSSSRRSNSSRGTSDSEPDSCEKRSLHNDMERQRRIDLRNLVEGLRVLVPEVADKKRAAKVAILKEAASYCHRLREQDKSLVARTNELQREQERLRARVSQLRRQVAARR